MTHTDVLDEIDFIRDRATWLRGQPKDVDGALLRRDDRDECGMLRRRVEELEKLLVGDIT